MRDGLNFMLSQSGYPFCAVANGAQGLERFAQGGIDPHAIGPVAARYARGPITNTAKDTCYRYPRHYFHWLCPPILCSQRLLKSSLNPSA